MAANTILTIFGLFILVAFILAIILSIPKLSCKCNLHHWYHGQFAYPVWGRSERHCLECDKMQYRTYKPLGWKTYNLLPNNGDEITITWLPNPKNNIHALNCYIGSRGIVEDKNEDGFVLRLESGASLIVGNKLKFKVIKQVEQAA